MKTRPGKNWVTAVLPDTYKDFDRLGVPRWLEDEIISQFHALGDMLSPERDDRIEKISRRDCPGLFRLKITDPDAARQLRGFVYVARQDKGNRRGVWVLIGVTMRNEFTYRESLSSIRDRFRTLFCKG